MRESRSPIATTWVVYNLGIIVQFDPNLRYYSLSDQELDRMKSSCLDIVTIIGEIESISGKCSSSQIAPQIVTLFAQ